MKKYTKVKEGDKWNKLILIKKLKVKLIGMTPRYYGLFKCECGNEKMILIQNVKNAITKSCGCNYKISNSRLRGKRKKLNARD